MKNLTLAPSMENIFAEIGNASEMTLGLGPNLEISPMGSRPAPHF